MHRGPWDRPASRRKNLQPHACERDRCDILQNTEIDGGLDLPQARRRSGPMANLLDYLDWRGDLTLEQDPFNEVDNLILAELSFVDFRGIVPAAGAGGRRAAAPWRRSVFLPGSRQGRRSTWACWCRTRSRMMLRKMAASPPVSGHEAELLCGPAGCGKGEQFAALTVETGDGALYLSFRGTDDTLAGWKEDFDLACMPEVPAQKKALALHGGHGPAVCPGESCGWAATPRAGTWRCTPGCSARRPCSGGLPPSGPTTARASTRTCWTCRPAPAGGGPDPLHRAQVLRGGDAAGARGGLHGGGQRPAGLVAARRLFLAGAGQTFCHPAAGEPPGPSQRPGTGPMDPGDAPGAAGAVCGRPVPGPQRLRGQ